MEGVICWTVMYGFEDNVDVFGVSIILIGYEVAINFNRWHMKFWFRRHNDEE